MDDAARAKVSGIPVQLDKRADEIFETLIASVPFEPDALEVDESPDTYKYALDSVQDEKSTVLGELQKLAMSELGLIYQKASGTLVFESRNRRAASEGIVDTFMDTSTLSGFNAAVARDDDSLEMHAHDTIKGSDFLADQDAVEAFVEEAPGRSSHSRPTEPSRLATGWRWRTVRASR